MLTAADRKRDAYLRRTYGLGLVDYDQLLTLQGGVCAICSRTPAQDGRNLAVDHVHVGEHKGVVRGLLCFRCNRYLIGRHRKDSGSIALLRAAADYLDREYHPFVAPQKKRKRRARSKA
jgi:hypothetical protein